MFGGNAKTHFQVLGRPSTTSGYMMSPFGDERWDLDDKEKLKKIFKNHEFIDKFDTKNSGDYFSENGIRNYASPMYKNMRPPQQQQQQHQQQQPVKQRHHGYIRQSETAQGYMPKSEIIQNYTSPQAFSPQPSYALGSRMEVQAPSEKPRFEILSGCLSQSSVSSPYKPVEGNNYYASPRGDNIRSGRTIQEVNNRCNSRSEPVVSDCCNCCHWEGNKSYEVDYPQKRWNLPVWVPGVASPYRPFGPKEPTPSPYFPPTERNLYMPLR